MVARRHGGGERAATLAGPHRCVDPRLVDEAVDDAGELGGERGVGVEHDLCAFAPADLAVGARHRRHPVVVGEPVDPEHLGLERVPALGDRVVVDDRVDERLHRLVGGLVGEVARRDPRVVVPQPVVDRLVEQQRVEHEGAGAQARLEAGGDGRAACWRTARSGCWSIEAACISGRPAPPSSAGRSTVIAEVSSSNRRTQAEKPVWLFSVTIVSSASVSRWGRVRRRFSR